MKFSVDSWHYKLVEYVYGEQYFFISDVHSYWRSGRDQIRKNISLCKYFWNVIYAILIAVPTAVIRQVDGSVGADDTIGISTLFYAEGLMGVLFSIIARNWWYLPIPWIMSVTLVGVLLGAVILEDKLTVWKIKRFESPSRHPPKPKKPSLLMAMLKAKKSKVCPIIEWEDPSKRLNAPTTPPPVTSGQMVAATDPNRA